MSEHNATIDWQRQTEDFEYDTYNRDHDWHFDGDLHIPASAAAGFLGGGGRMDPEEALVAAASSCHMLTFLAICARKRISVDHYHDEAVGYLEKNADNRLAVTRIDLRPRVVFTNEAPDAETLQHLHHSSHRACFIAQSLRTEIRILPRE